MKVIQIERPGGPEVLALAEKPLPEPAAGEVRVRAQAIGISSADMLVRKGVYNWMPPLPAVPGNEMAGVVDALGAEVDGVRVGERVLVSSRELAFRGGCYAEAICVPAAALFRLPDEIAPNDAGLACPLSPGAGAEVSCPGAALPCGSACSTVAVPSTLAPRGPPQTQKEATPSRGNGVAWTAVLLIARPWRADHLTL